MSLQDYVELTHACEKILEKFSKFERTSKLIGYSSSRQKSLQDKILKQSVIEKLLQECTTKSRFPRQPRNIYQEFFDHPHACCPTRNETLDLPMVYTIEELRGLVLEKSRRLPWQSGVVDVPSGEDDDWKFRVVDSSSICEKLVLLGYIKASSTTGFIKICDQTGKIAMHVGTTQTATKGNYNCIETLLDWKDCLIQVNKFDVVIESIQSCLFQTISGEKRTRIYIRTSLDCIKMILPKKTPFHEATTENIGRELYKKATSNENIECSTGPEQQESLSNSKQALASEPSGSRDQAVTCEKPLSTCVFTCQLLFLVRHRENLQLKKKRKVMYACAVDVKVLAYSTNKMQEEDVPNNDLSRMVLKNKSLVLRLQSEAVVFLPFLHDGCFYLLTESVVEEGNSVAMCALNSNVKSVLNVTSSMDITLARVTKDVVTEECHATRERSEKSDVLKAVDEAREKFQCDEEDKMQSVEEVLSRAVHPDKGSKSEVKQVNFQGIIVRREMRQSDTCGQLLPNKNVVVPRFGALEQSLVNQMELGYGYLGNKTLFLRVQDLCTPNTIDVYVDLSTAPYIDGLLPGTVVCCRRFLRKVSRNSNVYCSFEACSSLTVMCSSFTDQISPQPSTSNVNPQRTLLSAVPNRFLIDLVEGESSGNRIHTISRCRCRVTAIQKVIMRWHCSKCSQVIEREECPRGCRSEVPFRFFAEARCLVEDGTSEALVYLSDDMVAVLLSLPSQELSRLKSFALSLGELVYQRHSYGFDGQNKNDNANLLSKQYEANRILTERCVSQQVRRSVILYCKPVGSIGRRIDRTDQEYDTRPIIINQTEHSTFVLPKLQVKVIEMAEVDYQEEIKRMLLAVDELCNDDK